MTIDNNCLVKDILPDYLLSAIPYHSFNNVQSQCLDLWKSDSNFFISAPTGAGKTVCFELAIFRVIHQTLSKSNIKRVGVNGLEGKIVYLAPTKALCLEKGRDWQIRFSFLGIRVEILTGDTYGKRYHENILNADLIVSTIEKWDCWSRNMALKNSKSKQNNVSLLLLDEVHHVGGDRGPMFESVVARMFMTSDTQKNNYTTSSTSTHKLRIVGLSATVANPADIARWLRVSSDCCKIFGEEYRPIPLQYHIVGCSAKNPWMLGKIYDQKMLPTLTQFANGKPTLVFCTSRKQSITAAQALRDNLRQSKQYPRREIEHWMASSLPSQKRQRLLKAAKQCKDSLLRILIPFRIAVHNADMDQKDRHEVESLFKESLINCLFSTSTLAQGLNYPARVVVIAGTTVYHDGRLQEYDRNILLQMCGRAGRMGLDTEGVVVIMTSKSLAQKYSNLAREPPQILQSRLTTQLEDCLNAEIAIQAVIDVPSAFRFLECTFFWACTSQDIAVEQDGADTEPEDVNAEESHIRQLVSKSINRLMKSGLVNYDSDLFGLNSTERGVIMARYYMSLKTIDIIRMHLKDASSPAQVLQVISTCPELIDGTLLRRSEKRRLNELNEIVRMPIRERRIMEPWEKVFVLLQAVLNKSQTSLNSDIALKNEANRLLSSASRICMCILSLIFQGALKLRYGSVLASIQICRSFLCDSFWDGPTVFCQIPGITPSQTKVLCRSGIWTISKLVKCNPQYLATVLRCNIEQARKILSNAMKLPQFEVEVVRQYDNTGDQQVVTLKISVSVMQNNQQTRPVFQGGGFILIGSHTDGVLFMKWFSLEEAHFRFIFSPPHIKGTKEGIWFELIVGSDSFVGVDVVHKFNTSEKDKFDRLTSISKRESPNFVSEVRKIGQCSVPEFSKNLIKTYPKPDKRKASPHITQNMQQPFQSNKRKISQKEGDPQASKFTKNHKEYLNSQLPAASKTINQNDSAVIPGNDGVLTTQTDQILTEDVCDYDELFRSLF